MISGIISRLFVIVRPFTIRRRIVTVVIQTINASAVSRTWTHIFQKLRKIVQPFITNLDTSAAVMNITARIGVITALFHALPSSIFCGLGLAVAGISSYPIVTSPTPTGLRASLLYTLSRGSLDRAAVTSAKPEMCVVGVPGISQVFDKGVSTKAGSQRGAVLTTRCAITFLRTIFGYPFVSVSVRGKFFIANEAMRCSGF